MQLVEDDEFLLLGEVEKRLSKLEAKAAILVFRLTQKTQTW